MLELYNRHLLGAKGIIEYVNIGNLPGHEAESTFCHSCGKMVILRQGYQTKEVNLKDGNCGHCGTRIPGIWEKPQKA